MRAPPPSSENDDTPYGFIVFSLAALVIGITLIWLATPPKPAVRLAVETFIPQSRTIDTDSLKTDSSIQPLLAAAKRQKLRYLVVSQPASAYDTWTSGDTLLFYAIRGEKGSHTVALPTATYARVEAAVLLPSNAPIEAATPEFFKKNAALFEKPVSASPAAADAAPPVPATALMSYVGIVFTLVVTWLVVSPLRKRKNELNLTHKPIARSPNMIPAHKVSGDMDDLVGMADIKAEVLQLEHMLKNPDLYKAHDIEGFFNILLSGPAGTGKTKIVGYLAKALNIPLFSKPASSLETGLIGGGSETLLRLYAEARKHPLSIVFLDEGQVLLTKRGTDATRKNADDTANTLLDILDGTVVEGQNRVITVVASNFNDASLPMDPAMLRRFALKIDFRLPNLEERQATLKFYLDRKDPTFIDWDNLNLRYIADITAGLSPALLNMLTNKASLLAIQETTLISTELMFRAFERTTLGLTDRASTAGRDDERRRIARHEGGHLVVAMHAYRKQGMSWAQVKDKIRLLKISTEAVAKHSALGYVLSAPDDVALKSRSQLEQQVMEYYGGAAAEELYYGADGVSVGSENDFEKATTTLDIMVNQLSLYSIDKLNRRALKNSTPTDDAVLKAKSAELYEATLATVTQYRPLIDGLTEVLMTEYVLTKEALFAWLETQDEALRLAA